MNFFEEDSNTVSQCKNGILKLFSDSKVISNPRMQEYQFFDENQKYTRRVSFSIFSNLQQNTLQNTSTTQKLLYLQCRFPKSKQSKLATSANFFSYSVEKEEIRTMPSNDGKSMFGRTPTAIFSRDKSWSILYHSINILSFIINREKESFSLFQTWYTGKETV